MPITFGSIGDIISVSLLIKDLVKCLDESRGSAAEYQTVIRELSTLDHALLEVALLLPSCKQSEELSGPCNSAEFSVELCRKCVENFRDKMKKYQGALQGGGTGNLIRDTATKIRWHISKEDLAKFRAEVAAQSSSLNMLLATAGIKLTILNDESIHKRLKESELAHASSSATHVSLLADLKTRLEETNSLIQVSTSATKALGPRFDLDYFRNLGAELLSFVHRIWRINSMTYSAVASLEARIPAQLDRTWTQDPVRFEDALGRVTSFHLEFIDSWEAFESILEVRFRQLPGHRKIKHKEYALRSNLINKDVDTSMTFNRCFLPGQHYDMSMVFNATRAQNSCPACLLDTEEASGARVKCNGCGLWYQRVVETAVDLSPVVEKTVVPSKRPSAKRQREADPESDDEPRHFRRVRIRCRQRAREEGRPDETEFNTLSTPGGGTIRCVCGAQDELRQLEDSPNSAPSARTARTWLIQCVDCRDWQHRSCVGTANGNDPPAYRCERCMQVKPVDGRLNEDVYDIRCICDSDKDDGFIIYCDLCNTWQHKRCYYPALSRADIESLDHLCANCNPRPLSAVDPIQQHRLTQTSPSRHPKAQPSQGDAVLIPYMGGLNYPELATKAGSTTSDPDAMNIGDFVISTSIASPAGMSPSSTPPSSSVNASAIPVKAKKDVQHQLHPEFPFPDAYRLRRDGLHRHGGWYPNLRDLAEAKDGQE